MICPKQAAWSCKILVYSEADYYNPCYLSNLMENNYGSDDADEHYQMEPQEIISLNKFLLLSFLTLGLYELWWIYKAWRFFKQRNNLDIMPAARAVFSIFYLYTLLETIQSYARRNGYEKDYPSAGLFGGFIISNMLSRLPEPYWIVSAFSFVFLIQPFEALNYAKLHANECLVTEQKNFSPRQLVLMGIGIFMWTLIVAGLNEPVE